MAVSDSTEFIQAIVPTVVFPFVVVTAILSSLVTWIGSLFGLNWKGRGLSLKAVLKYFAQRKVILAILLANTVLFGGVKAYRYIESSSRPLWLVEWKNRRPQAAPDGADYSLSFRPVTQANARVPIRKTSDAGLRQLWASHLPDGAFRGVTITGSSIFVGASDGYVYEASRVDGHVLRRFYVGKMVTPAPLIWNNTLYAGEGDHATHHARIYAFDLPSGRLKGVIRTKGHTEGDLVLAAPTLTDGPSDNATLFIPAGSDGIYAVDPRTLAVRWHKNIGHFDSGVLVHHSRSGSSTSSTTDSVVFAATGVEKFSGNARPALYALDYLTGRELWRVELAASAWSRPVVNGADVCVALGEIYGEHNYGQLACYNQVSGEATRAVNFVEPLFTYPLALPDKLIVGGLKGTVCALARENLARLWCHQVKIEKRQYAALEIDGVGRIVVPDSAGLVTLDPSTGKVLGEWRPTPPETEWTKNYAQITTTDAVNDSSPEWYAIDAKGTLRKLIATK